MDPSSPQQQQHYQQHHHHHHHHQQQQQLEPPPPPPPQPQPPVVNYVLSFLLVGLAWGLTTPFIRRAARDHQQRRLRRPPPPPLTAARQSWWRRRVLGALGAAIDLLRNPRYAVPLVLNLTGSVWFFLLIGQAGMYLFHFVLL